MTAGPMRSHRQKDKPLLAARLHSPVSIKMFMLSGAATFSIKSLATGKHITYQIKLGIKGGVHHVQYLVESNWVWIGSIFEDGQFRSTRRCQHRKSSDAFKVFEWFYDILLKGRLPQDAEFYHAGKCGMCGRRLTDPISVQEGIGPECRIKRLNRGMMHDTVTS